MFHENLSLQRFVSSLSLLSKTLSDHHREAMFKWLLVNHVL